MLVLGLAIWLVPRGRETAISNISSGEQSLLTAQSAAEQGSRLLSGDPVQATTLLRQAWTELQHATTSGIPDTRTADLEADRYPAWTRCMARPAQDIDVVRLR